ncbi:MAG: formate--tetrahydrofolate ligase [Spirochaetes bacterium]|nr:formate--tetrahydrofolate ligase [Spirochaetota bacterium]
MKSDLEIARETQLAPISEIAEKIGLTKEDILPYGHYIAKVSLNLFERLKEAQNGKLILVTAMTPTPMGEGKTTTTIGLAQALAKIGKRAMIAIREPSLGPCMGVKGGAAGGGYSQVLPMEEINLHFTGDIHAVSIAHNLLAAIIDNHIHQKNEPELNPRDIVWRRVIDMNDRTLRSIIVGLEGKGANGVMREDGFDITAASEIMAILCLSNSFSELKQRLGNIIAGYTPLRRPVMVREIGAEGAMAALLKHALLPNLVQSVEGVPAFVHGGPFANIAHGCNSIIATKMALKLADYVVTEAGFGADLGAEKFFNIKCRYGNLTPSAAVLVVTARAFARHGIENIVKHAENVARFKVPLVISINRFRGDSEEELKKILRQCELHGLVSFITDFRESGGEGGIALAEEIVRLCDAKIQFTPLYPLDWSISQKIETIATEIYGADGVNYTAEAEKQLRQIEMLGFSNLPICMAKTQSSLSDNPELAGKPRNFRITISSLKVSAGAGFIVAYTGKIMTMPGLPKKPSALMIDIDEAGNITGLF